MFHINTEDDLLFKTAWIGNKISLLHILKKERFCTLQKRNCLFDFKETRPNQMMRFFMISVWHTVGYCKYLHCWGKFLTKNGYLKIIQLAINRLTAFAAHTSKFLSCCGVRLEKWRIVLPKTFRPPSFSEKGYDSYFSPTHLLLFSWLIGGLLLTGHLTP